MVPIGKTNKSDSEPAAPWFPRSLTRWLVLFCLTLWLSAEPTSAQTGTAAAFNWTTLAGNTLSGSSDGPGPSARFGQLGGIAMDASSNAYVVDEGNFTVRRISAAGIVTTLAGQVGDRYFQDGVNYSARFYSPTNIAVDLAGNLYVSDNYSIRQISPAGTNWVVNTIAGQEGTTGYRDQTNLSARFSGPGQFAVASDGTIYVADGAIRKVSLVGSNWITGTVANPQGYTIIQNFTGPNLTNFVAVYSGNANGLDLAGPATMYVCDQTGKTISQFTLRGTNWTGVTIAGLAGASGTTDGLGTNARFLGPTALTADNFGNVFVADGGQTVRELSPVGTNWMVTTVAGSGIATGSSNGVGTNALFANLRGVAANNAGNLLVTDAGGNNEIREVTSAGVVSTVAGSYVVPAGGSADGVGASAQFNEPAGVAVDSTGNVYVSDYANNEVRMITPAGVVSTLAGLATVAGTNDGAGNLARFNQPDGIGVGLSGKVFVVDTGSDTIRMITPAALVTTIAGTPNKTGSMDGAGTNALFSSPTDLAVSKTLGVFVADPGNSSIRLLTGGGSNWTVTTAAVVAGSPYAITLAPDNSLYVGGNNLIQHLVQVGGVWVITNAINNVETAYRHIAVDGSGNIYVPAISSHEVFQFAPVGTNWVLTIIGGSDAAPYNLGGNNDGAGTAAGFQIPYGVALDPTGNLYVSDFINNNVRVGVFALYSPSQPLAFTPPVMTGALQVTLQPPQAGGLWRFPWETDWRANGSTAANLPAGNYSIEFLDVPGWLTLPIQQVQVTTGATASITNTYLATIASVDTNSSPGSLSVYLGPTPPVGAGWRFLGTTAPFLASGYSTNLLPGTYIIEFAVVSGRVTPPSQAVSVLPGLPSSLSVDYLLATAPPAGVTVPSAVPANQITNQSAYPFGFNGQLQTDLGYGSGVAASTNVVLTAAHLVFNDQTLAYVGSAYWFFQQAPSGADPLPQTARGWYVLSGYAAQRSNDLQSGYSPDESTPPSRNLDVAALYFSQAVAGGASGGYLPSETVPNPWLSGTSLKMLVGYPVDGSQYGVSGIVPGQMYQTTPQPYALSLDLDPVSGQQEVYTASWFLSYPGNSGGPLYVQFNGTYYPAAVYLGTLFSGTQPYASVVRAIDSNVVTLITQASTLGDSGTNNSGGGVITIIPSLAVSGKNPGYLVLQLGPPGAVQAGAAWELAGQPASDYSTQNPSVQEIATTNALQLQFKTIPGWIVPSNRAVTVLPGPPTTNFANYTVTNPLLSFIPTFGLGLSGTANSTYQIQTKSSLSPGPWTPFSTTTITNAAFTPITNSPPPGFYRGLWLNY